MQIEPLRKLLEARQQLSNLLTYMDGTNGAERLISELLSGPAPLQAQSQPRKAPDAAPANPDE